MFRRFLAIVAVVSFAAIAGLWAGALGARWAGGAVDVVRLGGWHLWIWDDVLVLARFGPESDALQPATLAADVRWVMVPFATYGVVWGAFTLRRMRRRRKGRGFEVEPIQR